jgi:hypothetical protein
MLQGRLQHLHQPLGLSLATEEHRRILALKGG